MIGYLQQMRHHVATLQYAARVQMSVRRPASRIFVQFFSVPPKKCEALIANQATAVPCCILSHLSSTNHAMVGREIK